MRSGGWLLCGVDRLRDVVGLSNCGCGRRRWFNSDKYISQSHTHQTLFTISISSVISENSFRICVEKDIARRNDVAIEDVIYSIIEFCCRAPQRFVRLNPPAERLR